MQFQGFRSSVPETEPKTKYTHDYKSQYHITNLLGTRHFLLRIAEASHEVTHKMYPLVSTVT